MKISIIIPIYKVEQFVSRCIKSVINQSYNNIECIIIDDCSPDKSMTIVETLVNNYSGDIRFKLLYHDKNEGLSATRNTGIKNATGDYLLFIDSDDYLYDNNAISLFAKELKIYPNIDVIQGKTYTEGYMNSSLKNSYRYISEYYNNNEKILSDFFNDIIPATAWNKLIKKSLINSNNLFFNENIIHEDLYWNYYLFQHVKSLAFVDVYTYYYENDNEESIMNMTNKDSNKSALSYITIISSFLNNINNNVRVENRLFILEWMIVLADKLLKNKVNKETNERFEILVKKTAWNDIKEFHLIEAFFDFLLTKRFKTAFKNRFIRKYIIFKYKGIVRTYYKLFSYKFSHKGITFSFL